MTMLTSNSSQRSRALTKWHVDKLITYIAALTLIIDDYEVDTYDIQADLRLDDKE